jgi:hypothetical protein
MGTRRIHLGHPRAALYQVLMHFVSDISYTNLGKEKTPASSIVVSIPQYTKRRDLPCSCDNTLYQERIPQLTNIYSQNQKDVPRSRSQLLSMDSNSYSDMYLPLVVRDIALVRWHNHSIIRRRKRRISRNATESRRNSSHALCRPSCEHARRCW